MLDGISDSGQIAKFQIPFNLEQSDRAVLVPLSYKNPLSILKVSGLPALLSQLSQLLFEVDHCAWQSDGAAIRGLSKVQGPNPGWSVANKKLL